MTSSRTLYVQIDVRSEPVGPDFLNRKRLGSPGALCRFFPSQSHHCESRWQNPPCGWASRPSQPAKSNAVFSARMLSAREVVRRDQSPATAVSPILGKLYVRLGSGGGEKLFLPGEPIPLRGIGFPPRTSVEILVDNIVMAKAAVGRNRAFPSKV